MSYKIAEKHRETFYQAKTQAYLPEEQHHDFELDKQRDRAEQLQHIKRLVEQQKMALTATLTFCVSILSVTSYGQLKDLDVHVSTLRLLAHCLSARV